MSQVNRLEAQTRTAMGKRGSRNLRSEGIVPANLYGHNEDSQALQVCGIAVRATINSGDRLVDLVVDGKTEKALLTDVAWDTFGQHVLHVDFQRVNVNEKVHVAVPVQLKGTAPGVLVGGGILEQPHHEVHIECLATNIPHEFVVRIQDLQLGQFIHVSDLTDIPEGVTILDAPDTILVHIAIPKTIAEPVATEEVPAAPEAAGKKAEGDK
ncbi:MAG: 50S ribosomal protein L25 [Planctomycetaceae bacterium]